MNGLQQSILYGFSKVLSSFEDHSTRRLGIRIKGGQTMWPSNLWRPFQRGEIEIIRPITTTGQVAGSIGAKAVALIKSDCVAQNRCGFQNHARKAQGGGPAQSMLKQHSPVATASRGSHQVHFSQFADGGGYRK
jgi:hypothetical protein